MGQNYPEDLHKACDRSQQDPYNRDPVLVEVMVQPASNQPSDYAPRRQGNRKLNHRLGFYKISKRTFSTTT